MYTHGMRYGIASMYLDVICWEWNCPEQEWPALQAFAEHNLAPLVRPPHASVRNGV